MPTLPEAIIEAFKALGGERSIREIKDWVNKRYGVRWKDFGTAMADMVPLSLGGNPSSRVPVNLRVLKRMSIGRYTLTTGSAYAERPSWENIEPTITPKRPTIMEGKEPHSRRKRAVGGELEMPQSRPYSVIGPNNDRGVVEVWSLERLPFEPKGDLLLLREEICAAVSRLKCGSGFVLHGVYVSKVKDLCDTENILFYNVGTGCFARSARLGIRFERAFFQPPTPPPSMDRRALHYQSYRLMGRNNDFLYWARGDALARWSGLICPAITLGSIWYSMKRDPIEFVKAFNRPYSQFGLSVTLRSPRRSASPNLAGLIKPAFDGIVAAFYCHDGTDGKEVSKRLADKLGKNWKEIFELLNDSTKAALGTRRLLWPRGNGIQWNPGDEGCVAGELLFGGTSDNEFYELSGELFEVKETK